MRYAEMLQRIANVDIPHLEFAVDVAVMPDPEIVVAGIEGRAIVRAGMADIRRWIGERPITDILNEAAERARYAND